MHLIAHKRMIIIRRCEVVLEFDDGDESDGSDSIPLLKDCFHNDEIVEYAI